MFAITNSGSFMFHSGSVIIISGFFLNNILKHSEYEDDERTIMLSCIPDFIYFNSDT